MNQLKYKYFLL